MKSMGVGSRERSRGGVGKVALGAVPSRDWGRERSRAGGTKVVERLRRRRVAARPVPCVEAGRGRKCGRRDWRCKG